MVERKQLTTGIVTPDGAVAALHYSAQDVERAEHQLKEGVKWAFEEINPLPGHRSDPETCFTLLLYSAQRCARLDLRPLDGDAVWERYFQAVRRLEDLKNYVRRLYADYIGLRDVEPEPTEKKET